MKIVELAFTGYPVTDMERARAFYEGVLKLEPTRILGNGHWIEYDLGPSTFALSNMSKEEWKPSSDGPAVAFEVEDFDSAIARKPDYGEAFVERSLAYSALGDYALVEPDQHHDVRAHSPQIGQRGCPIFEGDHRVACLFQQDSQVLADGLIVLDRCEFEEWKRVRELMMIYADSPMDLAPDCGPAQFRNPTLTAKST